MQLQTLQELLDQTARHHHHLCPRQVLGVRMGVFAGEILELQIPQADKRLLTISETDGCFTDGVAVATNCWVGHRTMRIEDYGKIAATFVDTLTDRAIRLAPTPNSRALAIKQARRVRNRWEAQLAGYQTVPSEELFTIQRVQLKISLRKLISQPGKKAICQVCGEEIFNEREVKINGMMFCRACQGEAYYTTVQESSLTSIPS